MESGCACYVGDHLMGVTVKLDTTKLNKLIASVPKQADELTRSAAFLIQQGAVKNIMDWPLVDTGALMNSIGVEKISAGIYQVGDFEGYTARRKSRFTGREVSSGMEYGVYWELGHRNLFTRHYMRMPFLGPALVWVENKLTKMFADGLFK
jgi:hypothetical protein